MRRTVAATRAEAAAAMAVASTRERSLNTGTFFPVSKKKKNGLFPTEMVAAMYLQARDKSPTKKEEDYSIYFLLFSPPFLFFFLLFFFCDFFQFFFIHF